MVKINQKNDKPQPSKTDEDGQQPNRLTDSDTVAYFLSLNSLTFQLFETCSSMSSSY